MEREGHDPIPETISVSAPDRTVINPNWTGPSIRHERYRCAFSASDPANRYVGNLKQRLPHLILRRFIRIQESMQRVSVDSSSIASIGYAPEQQVLELEFRQSGEVYQYFDVPAEEDAAFLAADSKGTYLNLQFKPRQYRYHRVWPKRNRSSSS
jgi:hypothetical protein